MSGISERNLVANEEHTARLLQGVEAWNRWRVDNPGQRPDLTGSDLTKAHLTGRVAANLNDADLSGANLLGANLSGAFLWRADLSKAELGGAILRWANVSQAKLSRAILEGADLRDSDLGGADLSNADLTGADLTKADLHWANLSGANLRKADLSEADLRWAILKGAGLRWANLFQANLSGAILEGVDLTGANLSGVLLVRARLDGAQLDGCRVYGASIWDVSVEGASQRELIITPEDQGTLTVDDLKLAQFIYLLLENEEVRHIIDTITSKVVLILGRFTEERKRTLDALRSELRKRGYTPVLFDFDKPSSRDLTETISILAHMARFVIADITDAKSIPQELQKIVPNLPSLPIRPIILESQYEYGMFKDFGGYLSVLPPYRYQNTDQLLESLEERVINPALAKAEEISERRRAFEQELAKQ